MRQSRNYVLKYGTILLTALFMFSFTGCDQFKNEPVPIESSTVTSEEPTSSEEQSSTATSDLPSEYPSSSEELSSEESSELSSILSAISSVNQSSKEETPSSTIPSSSEVLSQPPVSSEPESSEPASSASPPPAEMVSYNEMKAVWLSYLEFQSFQGSNESRFTQKIQSIFDTISAMGLNTVIVQVRPHGDSFYPSEYYPWSKCISGTMGLAVDYDPLEIMVNEAHSRGLSVHAWVNPYRTMTDAEFSLVEDSYLIKEWYNSSNRSSYMIKTSDGRWWLQPGNEEVQRLIINGVNEIITQYGVDGIHLDDYFYNASPAQYGDTHAQATQNTTDMVRGIYQTVKTYNSQLQFGISPMGAFREDASLPLSDSGDHSTDLALWCSQPGYIDYVMPQIYWEYDHSVQPFLMTLDKWEDFVTEPSVAVYVGLAPYRLTAAEIESQIADIESSDRSSGYCLFRYDFIHGLTLS